MALFFFYHDCLPTSGEMSTGKRHNLIKAHNHGSTHVECAPGLSKFLQPRGGYELFELFCFTSNLMESNTVDQEMVLIRGPPE